MNNQSTAYLERVRSALLELDATGPTGFEGLLAAVLSDICGQPFRLASSGSQRGRDGDSAFDAGATYFECKRYQNKIPRQEIADKLMYLKADNQGQVDTWILAATSEVYAQDAKVFRDMASNDGIGMMILDWSDTSLPSLATALCAAKQATIDFLRAHWVPVDKAAALEVERAIDHISSLPEFLATSANLRDMFSRPSVGLGLAKSANRVWHSRVFSSRIIARQHFGQPLAPRDLTGLSAWPRNQLRFRMQTAFSGPPRPSVVLVMGEEGVGKSWSVADGWLAAKPASLLAVAPANTLQNPADLVGLEGFLIGILLRQTGSEASDANRQRWIRRLACWRANPNPNNVRVTLWIDGLDQATDFPWARWIDAAALFLEEIGGRLIITTRSAHYARFRNAMVSKDERVIVSDWTPDELLAILRNKGIDGNVLAPDVINTLRNPRVLGIAVELLDSHAIESMQELSVGRLLFEHLRLSNREGTTALGAPEFAKALQDLGREIFERLKANQQDDLKLVDARIHKRIQAVSSSRFFNPVGDDPDLYEIKEDGLQLALGLSLVDTLEKDARNGRAPSERLAQILGPIAALDMTADVVMCAIEVACLRDSCPIAVSSALVSHYVGLQNLPEERSDSFAALARKAPGAFVRALEETSLAAVHMPNVAWLMYALRKNREDPALWQAISERIRGWLATYSLSPDRRMFAYAGESKEKIAEKRDRLVLNIKSQFDSLTIPEREYVDRNLIRNDDAEVDKLHRAAFVLLSGKSLTEFAPALFNWALGNSLNSSIGAPTAEFRHLIQFNQVDWSKMRDSLLALLDQLPTVRSSVGDWTAVAVLRASGAEDDAAKAHVLAESLTKDREKFPSWRLIENYCRSDPCDPESARPDNIEHTAREYEGIDVALLRQGRGMSQEDYFFQAAMTGVARFKPHAAVVAVRRLSRDALNRSAVARRQAVLTLLSHSVLLDEVIVSEFVTAAQSSEGDTHSANQDNWISAQYSLFLALPHLTPDGQIAAVARMQGTSMLLSMMSSLQPASEQTTEDWLLRAERSTDEDLQVRVLGAIGFSGARLSRRSISVVANLMFASDRKVRVQAFGVAASSDDEQLLRCFAESGWTANSLSLYTDSYEIWYGSKILIAAAQKGIINVADALNRISLSYYGIAASRLGDAVCSTIADRVGATLANVCKVANVQGLPDIERQILRYADRQPQLVKLDDRYTPKDMKSAFEALSDAEFEARQERAHNEYQRFSKNLSEADASLVLADLGVEGVSAIIAARPEVVQDWHNIILSASPSEKRSLFLFAVAFAGALARSDATKALSIIHAVRDIEPLVRQIVGRSKLPYDAVTMWGTAGAPEFNSECMKRLDEASNDNEIAQEVLTAYWTCRGAVIEQYIDSRLAVAEPVSIARALMVAGFSDRNAHADAVLARYHGTVGFIGAAAHAAQYAYERNKWSRHWYEQMCATSDPIEFWRCSALLRKIVDGRMMLWENSPPAVSNVCKRFLPTLEREIDARIQKWQEQRRGKLFGENAPEPYFMH